MKYDITAQDIVTESACPLCKSEKHDEIAELYLIRTNTTFLKTVHCQGCGFVYRSKRPSVDWFLKCWNQRKDQDDSEDLSNRKSENEARRLYRYGHLEKAFAKILADQGEKTLLDLGTGTGAGLTVFRDRGWQSVGLEPDPARARIGVEEYGLDIRPHRMEDFKTSEKFNMVSLIQVLEHLPDPVSALQTAASFVNSGGYLYVEVPHVLYFVDLSDAYYLEHVSNFDISTLAYAGALAGLKVNQVVGAWTHPDGSPHLGIFFEKLEEVRPADLLADYEVNLWDKIPEPSDLEKWQSWRPVEPMGGGANANTLRVHLPPRPKPNSGAVLSRLYRQLSKSRPWERGDNPPILENTSLADPLQIGVSDITCAAHTLATDSDHEVLFLHGVRGSTGYFIFKPALRGPANNSLMPRVFPIN